MLDNKHIGHIKPHEMFRGKVLTWEDWFASWSEEYALLTQVHGMEKFNRVYDYFFRLLSKMQFGQWLNVQKTCPDPAALPMFHLVLEMIYQGDLYSQYRYDTRQGLIHVVAPDDDVRKRLDFFFPDNRYILNDQYHRWLQEQESTEPEDTEEQAVQPDDGYDN